MDAIQCALHVVFIGRRTAQVYQMIVFGSCVGFPEKLAKYAAPGVQFSMRGESYRYLAEPSNGTDIFPVYQEILEKTRAMDDVEALVLLHDDLEIRDPYLADKIREAFKDPDVAILGAIGSSGMDGSQGINWWEAPECRGYAVDGRNGHTVTDFGFDRDPCYKSIPTFVDTVDGMLLILSPWAIKHLTLKGLGYHGFHGYPEELCRQCKCGGLRHDNDGAAKKVQVSRFEFFHHTKGGITGDRDAYDRSAETYRSRWQKHRETTEDIVDDDPCDG